jgi:hypothetical protein
MAFQSKDGKKFGSAFVARRKDSEHDKADQMSKTAMGDSPAHEAAEKPAFEAGEQEGQTEKTEQNEQPAQVVAQHGAANTVHIAHDHKANKHHVISTHKDGHVHESEHATAKEAHDAATQLAGGDQAGAENPAAAPAAPEADGFSMPKLA